MIWLTGEQLEIVKAHPLVAQSRELAKDLSLRARELGTVDAINAASRAAETEYWLTVDVSHQMAQLDGRPDAST